jgi:hypothetical protein
MQMHEYHAKELLAAAAATRACRACWSVFQRPTPPSNRPTPPIARLTQKPTEVY